MLDVFRLRQYFTLIAQLREVVGGAREDMGFLDDVRRALLPLPFDRRPGPAVSPFPRPTVTRDRALEGQRVALMATGGSGALASVVGAARAFEEMGTKPSVISLCSGSALFGFPLAAGLSADEAAAFCLGLKSSDYVDVDWRALAAAAPTLARGLAGIVRGDRLEATYRGLLGDLRLGQLAIPAYAPLWNIEANRVEYLGPATHPDLPVARAVRMAVALPLFIQPVDLDGLSWCDGGIVDIFPVKPVLDIEPPSTAAVAVNGFYPPRFSGEDASGWDEERWSILRIASQVRTSQQAELARINLARLEAALPVEMIEPVPYEAVRGVGFYRQFLDNRDWAGFMAAGRNHTLDALGRLSKQLS